MARLWWVLLLVAPVAAPPATAETIENLIALEVDADQLLFRSLETRTGIDAKNLRSEIDVDYGDDDGVVDQAELDAYHRDNHITYQTNRPSCFERFDLARIDGQAPVRISEIRETVRGALGPTSSMAAIEVEDSILFQYPRATAEPPTVTIRFSAFDSFGYSVACYATGFSNFNWGWIPPGGCCAETAALAASPSNPSSSSYAAEGEYWIHPYADARIARETIQPNGLRPLWDGRGLQADTESERDLIARSTIVFEVEDGVAAFLGETVRNVGTAIGYATVGVSALAIVGALSMEHVRYQLLKWLIAVPLFTRLEKDDVLEHSKREELYRFIKNNPGPSFSDIRRELELSNGTLVHHLRILEAQEFVKPVRDGFRTRFYIRGPKIVPTSYLTRTQQGILDAIASNPGVTQKELSQMMGLPRESVSYHTKKLASQGQVQIRQEGKWRRYFAVATSPSLGASLGSGSP